MVLEPEEVARDEARALNEGVAEREVAWEMAIDELSGSDVVKIGRLDCDSESDAPGVLIATLENVAEALSVKEALAETEDKMLLGTEISLENSDAVDASNVLAVVESGTIDALEKILGLMLAEGATVEVACSADAVVDSGEPFDVVNGGRITLDEGTSVDED